MSCTFEKKSGRIKTINVEQSGAISERVVFEDSSGETFFLKGLHGHYDIPSAYAWFIRGNGISDICALEGLSSNGKTLVDFNADQFLYTKSNIPRIIDIMIKIISALLIFLLISLVLTVGPNPITIVVTLIDGVHYGIPFPTLGFYLIVTLFVLIIAKVFAINSSVMDGQTYQRKKAALMHQISAL